MLGDVKGEWEGRVLQQEHERRDLFNLIEDLGRCLSLYRGAPASGG